MNLWWGQRAGFLCIIGITKCDKMEVFSATKLLFSGNEEICIGTRVTENIIHEIIFKHIMHFQLMNKWFRRKNLEHKLVFLSNFNHQGQNISQLVNSPVVRLVKFKFNEISTVNVKVKTQITLFSAISRM